MNDIVRKDKKIILKGEGRREEGGGNLPLSGSLSFSTERKPEVSKEAVTRWVEGQSQTFTP